jgi:hypothetical protein
MTGKRRLGDDSPQEPRRPAPAPTPKVGPRQRRRDLRAEERKQKRRRFGTAGVVGLVVAGLAVAAGVTFGVTQATSDDEKKPPLGQTTLLLSLTEPDGTATETALLAHDSRTKQGVELLMPTRLLIDVCGFGNQQLGDVLALPDGQRLSRVAVSDMLSGATVDGSWVLTTSQFAKLVDLVGGVTVDVDDDVIQRRADGSRVVLVQRGPQQRLDGAQATAFATYTARGEDATANLVRLQQVLDGLLLALPQNTAEVQQRVATLGKGAGSTLGPERLAEMLVGLAADARANTVLPTDLPIVKIDVGEAQSSYRVDSDAARQFVNDNLAASWPASARTERKRVLVQNGVGTPGLVGSACTKLVDAGYVIAGTGNATHLGFDTSKVLVFDSSVESAQLGNAVARALRLPTEDVAVSTNGQNVADVLVILGKDYKP